MKRILSLVLTMAIMSTIIFVPTVVSAETYGDLTYKNNGYYIEITGCNKSATSVDIPAEIEGLPVTSIENFAFRDCTSLINVTIPDSITSIGRSAFEDCTKLTDVTIPNSVNLISSFAFYNCTSLTDINIPDTVKFISDYTFSNCTSLTDITIPDNVTNISYEAFSNTEYYNNKDNWLQGVLYIGNHLIKVEPAQISTKHTIKNGTKCIAGRAFENCTNLTEINIPVGVTSIGQQAFCACYNLTNIIIPNSVTSIGSDAFASCTGLTDITISNSVTSIGFGAFFRCESLTNISIPDSVTSISSVTFDDCSHLTKIIIPASVTSIERDAFHGCDSLTDVYYGGSQSEWNQIYIIDGNECLTNANIHFNSTGPGEETEPSNDMPENINNVTINGHGTAFGWFKVLDNDGNPYTNMPVSYRIDGGKASNTTTDENGYAGVIIENIKKSKDYSVEVFGTGIPSVNGVIHVTVNPLAFTSSYEAAVTQGKSVALGIGVSGKIGNLEAEAEAASVGFDAENKKSLLMTQESVNDKTKLTVTASENATIALSAKAGLFAGAKADGIAGAEMSAGEINGKASYGSGIGATFKDDDFDIHNSDDIWDLSKFMLSIFLESGKSNIATRYLIKKINAPVDSYTGSSSALLSAGAKLGNVKAGLAGGELETDLFSINGNSLFTYSTTVDKNSTKYQSGISVDAGYKCFDLSFGNKTPNKKDMKYKTGIALKTGGFVDNSVNFGATRNSKGLNQLSFTSIDNSEESIFWKKTSMTSKYTVSYSGSAAQSVAASDEGLKKFSEGKKGFFSTKGMQTAANAMMKSGEQGTYNTTYEYKKGIDINASAGAQIFLKFGLNVGLSGIEGYEYESESGLYANDTIYLQSQSDIKKDVENKFVGVEDLMALMTKPITDFVSSCWDTVSGWLDSGVKKGKAVVKKFKSGVKNLWVSITSPKDEIEASAIEAINDETADAASAGIATTLGEPYIVSAELDGVEVSDFSDSPMLLSIEYTQAQLSDAGVTDLNDIAIYKWDADKCVYIRMGGTLDSMNSLVELEITKPGQYILAADNMPPAVSAFKSSNSGTGQEITALISDMSGIAEFGFSIDGEEKVNMGNLDDYYDSTSGKFAYPVTDLAEGDHTAAIYAADSAGNAMVSPVELSFSVNAAAPVIENLTLPSGTVKNNDSVTAVVSGENISSVLLNIKETDPLGKEITSSYEMTNQNGEYTALIQGITPGNKTEIWVTAYNTDGNGAESEKTTVLAVSGGSGPEIMITDARDNSVTVTTVNGASITDAEVLLAAYDENGTLKQAEIKEYLPELVFDNIDLNIGEIKAYLWDNNQQPLCGAAQLYTAFFETADEPNDTPTPAPTLTPASTDAPATRPPRETEQPTLAPIPTEAPPTLAPTIPAEAPATRPPRETEQPGDNSLKISVRLDKTELAPGESAVVSLIADRDFETDLFMFDWTLDNDFEFFDIDENNEVYCFPDTYDGVLSVFIGRTTISVKAGEPFYSFGIKANENARKGRHSLPLVESTVWDTDFNNFDTAVDDIVIDVK